MLIFLIILTAATQIGLVPSAREVPGFLALLVVYGLRAMNEHRLVAHPPTHERSGRYRPVQELLIFLIDVTTMDRR